MNGLCRPGAVDPIKIYEYISLGLPTVVTGMPHLAGHPGVLVAETEEQFASAIAQAAGKRLDKTTVAKFLGCNRWSNRVDTLLEALEESDTLSGVSLAIQETAAKAARAAA